MRANKFFVDLALQMASRKALCPRLKAERNPVFTETHVLEITLPDTGNDVA